ncbi:hypothetical protein PIIN_08671 [Serendipita indica DSM 11827]|uniref:Uncharacterized protein n=1 Tax=Serendipita indica (strain DSM 11827) TaxID=1109443 RepID=G4TTR8_SERID|nr:hypothetical protein PIIN_08671 [Serendipita indica DSM 11827]
MGHAYSCPATIFRSRQSPAQVLAGLQTHAFSGPDIDSLEDEPAEPCSGKGRRPSLNNRSNSTGSYLSSLSRQLLGSLPPPPSAPLISHPKNFSKEIEIKCTAISGCRGIRTSRWSGREWHISSFQASVIRPRDISVTSMFVKGVSSILLSLRFLHGVLGATITTSAVITDPTAIPPCTQPTFGGFELYAQRTDTKANYPRKATGR